MNKEEELRSLEDVLRRANDRIDYLQYLLMTAKAWKRETKFRISKIQSFDTTTREKDA